MSPTHPRFKGGTDLSTPRRAFSWRLWLGLCGCAAPLVCAAATAPEAIAPTAPTAPPAPITQISIERDCFGCASGTLLTLRADGAARRVQRGKARHGTLDLACLGSVRAADFAALAKWVDKQQFFAMDDAYQDPDLQDGPWTVVSVVRGAQEKRVFRRDEAGPDALKQLESRIDEVAAKIVFSAAPC